MGPVWTGPWKYCLTLSDCLNWSTSGKRLETIALAKPQRKKKSKLLLHLFIVYNMTTLQPSGFFLFLFFGKLKHLLSYCLGNNWQRKVGAWRKLILFYKTQDSKVNLLFLLSVTVSFMILIEEYKYLSY